MKKICILLAILTFSIGISFAQQKLAYVDTEYVLKHIPDYIAAQKKMDDLSAQWQQEVDKQYGEIEKLYKAYQNDQSLLNADMRRRREDEIVNKEKQVKDFQKAKFGFQGELFQERQKLIQPIQDRVAKAIKDIAATQGLDLVFNKGSETTFIFANPSLDKSNDVVVKLGFKPNPALAETK
ncbi:OmpH family outer membrane protein [Sphingobacterium sp. Mn56C]|uniref:OmpH family outer membrane protein n=1 Tax=Sphingobacterium sp. Mn56C TaxID=3395261 RepID=UPI003BDEAD55